MKADELRLRYAPVVVTSCEWRTIGLADPDQLAEQVFAIVERQPDPDLHDLYRIIERVALEAFSRHADQTGLMARLASLGRGFDTPAELRNMLTALSRLRQSDRELLQRRHWDSLDLRELAESLRTSPEQVRAQLTRAEERFLGKARRFDRELVSADVVTVVVSLKPGERRRYP